RGDRRPAGRIVVPRRRRRRHQPFGSTPDAIAAPAGPARIRSCIVKTRTLLRLAAASAWLLAIAPIGASFGADTSAPPEYGWWNKQQALPVQGDPTGLGLTTVPTVPAPPTVPADGLYVADD